MIDVNPPVKQILQRNGGLVRENWFSAHEGQAVILSFLHKFVYKLGKRSLIDIVP
jgi:hypothetical protein